MSSLNKHNGDKGRYRECVKGSSRTDDTFIIGDLTRVVLSFTKLFERLVKIAALS
jgi:hypothetical protein